MPPNHCGDVIDIQPENYEKLHRNKGPDNLSKLRKIAQEQRSSQFIYSTREMIIRSLKTIAKRQEKPIDKKVQGGPGPPHNLQPLQISARLVYFVSYLYIYTCVHCFNIRLVANGSSLGLGCEKTYHRLQSYEIN